MTVSAITPAQQLNGAQGVNQAAWQQRMQEAMGPVAQLFNETPQQLMQQLQSGSTSLASLAQANGISQSSLRTAIQQGLQQAGGPASSMSSSQLSNLAGTIASRAHRGHHHHHGGMSDASGVSAIAGATTGDDGDDSSTSASASTTGVASATTTQQVDLAQVLFSLRSAQTAQLAA